MSLRAVSASVLAVTGSALAVAAVYAVRATPRTSDATPTAVAHPSWRYPNESAWIVGDVLTAIAAMADVAQGRPGPAAPVLVRDRRPGLAGSAVFEITNAPRSGPATLTFREHVFDPDVYLPYAAALFGSAGGATDEKDRALPTRLTHLTLEALHTAGTEVSEALTRAPRSVAGHEDAALLLAGLAFREAAAGHSDPRHEMTRIAAHLAIAAALRGGRPESASARLAHLTLLALAGRTADVVARLGALPPTVDSAEGSWRRALRMRATGDWRAYSWKGAATLIERLAWFRAYRTHVASDRAYRLLEELPGDESGLADWGRITLTGQPSVRDCHQFAVGGVAYDLEEAMRAARLFGVPVPDPRALTAALNGETAPGGVVRDGAATRIVVLDWGRFAAFLQRHVGARLSYELACLERVFGLPAQVPRALAEQEASFGNLTLFPFEAQRWVKTAREHSQYSGAAAQVVLARPQLVTPHLWHLLFEVPAFSASPPPIPPETAWFDPVVPFGTGVKSLRGYLPAPRQLSAAALADLIRIDPYNAGLRGAAVRQRLGAEPPYEALRDAYGAVLEWDLQAMREVAVRAGERRDERRRWLSAVCEVDTDRCHELASFLKDIAEEDAAALVYRKWWREALDRVRVSNSVRWLVEYDEGHGRAAEATEIAQDAAGTGSFSGMDTLAWLEEKRGRIPQAETLARGIAERYDDADYLYEFYTRRIEAGEKRFDEKREALVTRTFPGGFEKLAGFPAGPPADGVVLSGVEPRAKAAGLVNGDIVVALDGIRVHNRGQWRILRKRGTSPQMRLLLYRAGTYREVAGTFKDRLIPAYFGTFPTAR